jgi:ABC-2 type transport system permease protein
MKRFKAFVIKEFRHLLRDPRTVFVLFAIPIIQLLLFGYVISTEIKNVHIAILDNSNDVLTQKLTNKLMASDYFILEKRLSHENQIDAIFKEGKIKEVIIFESGFENKFVHEGVANMQIITDASDPNTASLLDAYTRRIVASFLQEMSSSVPQGIIQTEFRMFFNEELRSAYLFVPGTMALILMLISALMTSVSITREKELGTMEILLVSPLRPLQIVLGKLVPYLTLSVIDMIGIIAVGNLVFDVPVRGSLLLLMCTGTLFILLALTLGVMISTIAKTQQVAMIISLVGLMLPTVLLSGFIFPIKNMPLALQYFSLLMPPRWFLEAIKDIMLKGLGFKDVWKEILIMTGMLMAFIVISVKKFKIRLE